MSVIGVGDLWKMFEFAHGRKAAHREAVDQWLDAVYMDIEDLSNVWLEICAELESGKDTGNNFVKALKILNRGKIGMSQRMFAGRLTEFYESVSAVLRQRQADDRFHDQFVNGLGRLLVRRGVLRSSLDREIDLRDASTLSEEMRKALLSLQDEATKLQVLIKTFKATTS